MVKSDTKVVVIDDNYTEDTVPMVILREHFQEVILKNTPKEGADYVKKHKLDRLIVVLDYQFGENEPTGYWVLKEIRKESFIIPVILMTDNQENLTKSEFPDFINEKLFAFSYKSDYKDLIQKIKKADIELSTKVEVALEDWIDKHSPEDKEKPYLTMRNGKTYRLIDILKEVRLQTDFGQKMERKILNLAIELLANDIKKL